MRTGTFALVAAAVLLATTSQLVARVPHPVRIDGWTGPDCGRDIQAVCNAYATADKAERVVALTRALDEALQSTNRGVRLQAFTFLCALGDDFDPRPLRAALTRLDKLERRQLGVNWVDEYELAISSREDRARVYHRAIADGEVEFGAAGALPRERAVRQAAREGLTELEPLIERVYPEMSDRFQRENPLPYLRLSLKLHEGAENRTEVGATAVKRLIALPAQELCENLRSDPLLRRLVVETNTEVCGGKAPEECDRLKKAVDALLPILVKARTLRRSQEGGQGAAAGQDDDDPVWSVIRSFSPE